MKAIEKTQTKTLLRQLDGVTKIKAVDCLKMTPEQAAKGTQLSALKKHPQGEIYQVVFITKALNELKSLVKCEANADQLVLWAELIAAKYWHFKAEELIKALIEGASNKYGKTYGALNFQFICEWLDHYEQIKIELSENNHAKTKEAYDPNRQNISLKEYITGKK